MLVRSFWGLTSDFWAENAEKSLAVRQSHYFQLVMVGFFTSVFSKAGGKRKATH
jgi:hypothetical protein